MIITGIRDLALYEPRGKTTEQYLEGSTWLLGSRVPMVIFCDRDYGSYIRSKRPEGAITHLYVDDEPLKHDPRVEIGIARSGFSWNPAKDTPRYFALMRRKLRWLARGAAIAGGPVTWCDIAYRPKSPDLTPDVLLTGPSSRIRLAELSHVPKAVRHDRNRFYAQHYWPVAGGVIRGEPDDLAWLDARVEEEWQWCLEHCVAATDEMMMGFIRFQHPDRFETYYADHPTLVDNWELPRESRHMIHVAAFRAMDDGCEDESRRRFQALAQDRQE